MYSISVSESVNQDAIVLENLNPELIEKAMRFLLSKKDLTGFKFYTYLVIPNLLRMMKMHISSLILVLLNVYTN